MVICAAGLSPVRGLPHRKRPHYCLLTPSPSCAAGSLASARSPRTARIPQARRLLCSSTGQRCCLAHAGVSHGVLTRRAHTARSHGVRTTQTPRLRRRGHILSSPEARALSGQIIAPASGAAAGRALGYRPRLNCGVRGQLLPLDLGPASSSSWTRSVCRPRLASAPPRTQHLNPAHTRAQPTGTARPLLLGRRRALETVDAEVDDAGSTMPSTAPAVAAVVSLATAA